MAGALLILLVGGYFVSRFLWGERLWDKSTAQTKANVEGPAENLNFMEPKVLFQKLQNKDSIIIIDIRPPVAYDTEHIPGSLWLGPSALGSFSADPKTTVVIVPAAEDPLALEVAHNTLSEKGLAFSFLRGGFEAWKFAGYQTVSQGTPDSFVDQSKITYITPTELKTLLTASAGKDTIVLLDVQPENRFRRVHLKGAMNIPLADLEKRKDEIPSAKEIIVYGENELASFQGGVRLADLHFFTVRTLTGNDHLSAASPLFREP